MATIGDVSKLAKVSVATVSRVLNDSGYVKEETRERVIQAIKELNYRPNALARSLFKGKSKMIALFVPDIMNPFFPELARAVEDVSNAHEYTFILCNTDNDPVKEVTYLETLLQKLVDGMVMISSTMSIEQIKSLDIPIVALDRKLDASIPSVTVNNIEGAMEAVHYLKELGLERVAHITGPETVISAMERFRGYLNVLEKETWFQDTYIQYGDYTYESGYHAAKELLTTQPATEAIFAANDMMAIGALKAAEHLGVQVPQDMSIIGFDGIQMGKTTSPSLTTMAQPFYTIGKKATELLIQQIEEPKKVVQSKEYHVTLVERESTKKGEHRDA